MIVETNKYKYCVNFELERRPHAEVSKRDRNRAITHCKIFYLAAGASATLIGEGETLQGRKDAFNSVTGCTYALKRALADAKLNKQARTLFWKEFNRCHRRQDIVTCREAFANVGGLPYKLIDVGNAFEDEARRVCEHRMATKGSGVDWCTKHRIECSTNVQCGVTSAESTPGYGGLYSFQKRARALRNPVELAAWIDGSWDNRKNSKK